MKRDDGTVEVIVILVSLGLLILGIGLMGTSHSGVGFLSGLACFIIGGIVLIGSIINIR